MVRLFFIIYNILKDTQVYNNWQIKTRYQNMITGFFKLLKN